MKELFDVHIKLDSWISQKWNPSNFPKAFIDEYMAILNLVASTIYDFAAENKQEIINKNILTLANIKDDFISDYTLVMAKFGLKKDNELIESIKNEISKIREFRLDFKMREDKTLTKEEQLTRLKYHILYFANSIKYEVDCINENNNKKQYEDLVEHTKANHDKLIKQANELGIYDEVNDMINEAMDCLKIDESKLKYPEVIPENKFKASDVY